MLENRNQLEIEQKLKREMEREGLDALILTEPETILYASGFASHFLYGSRRIGTTLAVVRKEGPVILILNEIEKQTAENQCKDIKMETYPVWIYIDGLEDDGLEKPSQPDMMIPVKMALDFITERTNKAKIGVQSPSIPHDIWDFLSDCTGVGSLCNCEKVLNRARAIKTDWEIGLLRRTAKITESAMLETAYRIVPGMSEKEILSIYRNAAFSQDLDVIGAYTVSGIGTEYSIVQIPRNISVKENDIIRLDGGANICGYQADIARTFVVGKPEDKAVRIFEALYRAFDAGRSMIGPGVPFEPVFHAMQDTVRKSGFEKYTRGHCGHSVGCNIFVEERPFVAPGEEQEFTVFMPGMVMSIEVPFYSAAYGAFNIEDTVLITERGCEWFTTVNDSLFWPKL